VDGPDQLRATQTGDVGARTDAAPAHRHTVAVGDHALRLGLGEVAHGLLTALPQLRDLAGGAAVGEAPAVVLPTVRVDHVGEVVETLGRDRVGLPHVSVVAHGATVATRPAGLVRRAPVRGRPAHR